MTDYEIFHRAMLKALDNGLGNKLECWEHYRDRKHCNVVVNLDLYKSIIFRHDFAEMFWGKQKHNIFPGAPGDDLSYCNCGACAYSISFDTDYCWQWHLQQMVLEENPLQYLAQFLDEGGEMKYITLFITVLYLVFCIFVFNSFNKYERFYKEFNEMAEMLNDRILYVKVLQEGDTLWFISEDLRDTSWIVNDTSWIIQDTIVGMDLVDKEWGTLYLMGDVFIYPDQFSGNTYVINAKGDTIFKYIKREGE